MPLYPLHNTTGFNKPPYVLGANRAVTRANTATLHFTAKHSLSLSLSLGRFLTTGFLNFRGSEKLKQISGRLAGTVLNLLAGSGSLPRTSRSIAQSARKLAGGLRKLPQTARNFFNSLLQLPQLSRKLAGTLRNLPQLSRNLSGTSRKLPHTSRNSAFFQFTAKITQKLIFFTQTKCRGIAAHHYYGT